MISAQPNKPQQEKLIMKLMELPNSAVCVQTDYLYAVLTKSSICQWDSLMAQAAQNMDVLSNIDNIKILANVLKTNVSACTSIGSFYLPQLGKIFLDMLGLYKAVSGIISETVAREGEDIRCSQHLQAEIIAKLRSDCHEDTQDTPAEDCEEGNT